MIIVNNFHSFIIPFNSKDHIYIYIFHGSYATHIIIFTEIAAPSGKFVSRTRAAATMDRLQLVLVALPLFLFCSDIFNLFAPPPPPPPKPSSAPRPRSPLPNLHSNGLSHSIVTEAIPKVSAPLPRSF